jgi:tetratricopeptide (TPR) repeat protein
MDAKSNKLAAAGEKALPNKKCRVKSTARIFFALASCLLAFLLLGGCASLSDKELKSLGKTQVFQKAYEAVDVGNYVEALRIYNTYKERFPDDLSGSLWTDYEIAFLYHKMGNDAVAQKMFEDLLLKYKNEGTAAWPQAQRILSERVLKAIKKDDLPKTQDDQKAK